MPVTSDVFRRTLGHFGSGVTVVTAATEERMAGLTVSAFSSVSLNPPLILVCIHKQSSAVDVIRDGGKFAVNLLSEEQIDVSNHFASQTPDKFQNVAVQISTFGLPILEGSLGFLECSVFQEVDAGDHYVYIGQVENAETDESKHPLLYYHGRYETLSSKNPVS